MPSFSHGQSVKDICKDGKIKKFSMRERMGEFQGWRKVLVIYGAQLGDRTVISKSDGAEYTVIDAKGVKSVKKSEKVLLTVEPQYAYGEKRRLASKEDRPQFRRSCAGKSISLYRISDGFLEAVTEIGMARKQF